MLVYFLLTFLGGILSLALAEIFLTYFFIKRCLQPRHPRSSLSSRSLPSPLYVDSAASGSRSPHVLLQGDIWVAPVPLSLSGKDASKDFALRERVIKDSKKKKDVSEEFTDISPIKKHARLEGKVLIFAADDGSKEHIDMTGCSVLSVSGGKEFSRKWAKKYPIKLESKDRPPLLLYLDTGWEKEAWCQVLRAASDKSNWYINQKKEFHDYFLDLYKAYPSFARLAPFRGDDVLEEKPRAIEPEAGLSRRQKLWKKFTKKGSLKGSALESKGGSSHEDSKGSSIQSRLSNGSEDLNLSVFLQSQLRANEKNSASSHSASCSSLLSDSEKELMQENISVLDQGTMCWNMLFSRLFFDSYHNSRFQAACQRLIQKQLSKIITPGYIAGINCTNLEVGTTPPFFHSMQILPKDMDSIWSFEAGIEYSGGARIEIQTRLDVHDSVSQEIVLNQSLEPTLSGEATADILQHGLESMQKSGKSDKNVQGIMFDSELMKTLNPEPADLKNSKAFTGDVGSQLSKGGWKAVLSRFAGQVSQVPFTLSLRLVSLKGTMRVQIKGAPTDRIWFGFTSMPTIELKPEPSIGEHKITTSPVVAFFTNRIKMLVQDTLVLPNCESLFVPWMISEKDDWIQRSAMPVPWSPHDNGDLLPPEELRANAQLKDHGKSTVMKETQSTTGARKSDVSIENSLPRKPPILPLSGDRPLTRPLLETLDSRSEPSLKGSDISSPIGRQVETSANRGVKLSGSESLEEKGRDFAKRSKVFSLGKKVWEKLDEKGQNMLTKVREGFEKNEQAGQ